MADLPDVAAELERLEAQVQHLLSQNERLRMLSDRAVDIVLLHDGKGRMIDANRTAWESLGYTREEFLELNIRDLDVAVARIPLERYGQNWARMQPGVTVNAESEHRHRDGHLIPIEVRVAVFEQDGERLFVATCRDITQRKAAERAHVALTVAKLAAEEANRAKSAFLTNMSHELRTPLNAVIGYAELLVEEAQDLERPQMISDLERIRSSGKHLLSVINDILDLSKVEAGKMELFCEEVAVDALLEDVVGAARSLAEARSNTLELIKRTTIGARHTDPTRLRQILFNLLSNACKFTQAGRVTVRAEARMIDGMGWTSFTVQDTGIGIHTTQMGRLFEPFSQADASTTKKYGGTGLGLSITRRLCEMLGGSLQVESALGAGSTFTVLLPDRHA
jgi:PAS domain S-box-containing protein